MKYLFLLIAILLAAAPLLAKAEDFTSANRGLPAVFKRGEFLQTYFCAVVKITYADNRVSHYIGNELSVDDIGSYVVLSETHVALAGGSSKPRLVNGGAMSYLGAVEQLETNSDCGAGAKELSDSEWKADLEKSFSDSSSG